MIRTELQKSLEKLGYKTTESNRSGLLKVTGLSIGDVKKIFCILSISYLKDFEMSEINQTSPNVFDINFKVLYGEGEQKSSLQKSLEARGHVVEKHFASDRIMIKLTSLVDLILLGRIFDEKSFNRNGFLTINQDDSGITLIFDVKYGTEE